MAGADKSEAQVHKVACGGMLALLLEATGQATHPV
jgi:hypothetical protein